MDTLIPAAIGMTIGILLFTSGGRRLVKLLFMLHELSEVQFMRVYINFQDMVKSFAEDEDPGGR